jgi:hypothetical protein
MNRQRFSWASRIGSRTVTLALMGMFLGGCGEEGGERDELEPPEESAEAAVWRVDIRSADPVVRARAMDLVPGAPGSDGLEAVERLAVHDPDARVREQAVLAYRVLAGAEGERLLKEIALGDESEAVTSTALAALHSLRAEHPRPERAWMNVDFSDEYQPGETIVVHVRFGSTESAPKAMLQLRPPKGFTFTDRESLQWRGAVDAGRTQDIAFQLVAPREPMLGGARVRLFVDYPEALDAELLQEHVRVRGDESGGRFEGRPPPRTRTVDGTEVQP